MEIDQARQAGCLPLLVLGVLMLPALEGMPSKAMYAYALCPGRCFKAEEAGLAHADAGDRAAGAEWG